MAIVKISDLPLVDSPVEGTDLFVVVQDNVTKKAYASDIQTYVGFEEVQTATAGQTVFNLTTMTYAAGANNLQVFVDGVNQYEGSSYTETDNNTVTFSQGLHEGALVKFSTVQTQTSSVANAGAVTFLQAGTGAVPRSVQSKERDIVSVKDFGAVGDGVTDDTAAIQAAISAASVVYFPTPSSSYYITSAITIPSDKTLVGEEGAKILANTGITALWVQGNTVTIKGITVEFNTPLGNFSNTNSIGILVRDVNSFGSPASAWVYRTQIQIEDCRIYKAYKSIQMEAIFYCSLNNVNTYNDFYSLIINKDQETVYGGGNVPLPATTIFINRFYAHGTQTNYAIPANSIGFDITGVQILTIQDCVTEFVNKAINLSTIAAGSLSNHYMEEVNVGVDIFGALTPFLVVNPWVRKGSSSMTYCFRSGAGNMTFIGGNAQMSGGADVFYSPNPGNNGTCTFLKQPSLSNAQLQVGGNYAGGFTADNSLVINQSVVQANNISGWVSGVAKTVTTRAAISGGMFFVTGYSSLPGDYSAIVTFSLDGTVSTSSVHNTTGGTVVWSSTPGSGTLQATSTGTSSQILQELWVSGFVS